MGEPGRWHNCRKGCIVFGRLYTHLIPVIAKQLNCDCFSMTTTEHWVCLMYIFFFHVHQTNLYIKLLFYVLYVNFKLYSLIILSLSLGFIVKIFDPGQLKMVSREAAYNDKKTKARDTGNKQKTTWSRRITLYLISLSE